MEKTIQRFGSEFMARKNVEIDYKLIGSKLFKHENEMKYPLGTFINRLGLKEVFVTSKHKKQYSYNYSEIKNDTIMVLGYECWFFPYR